MPWTSHPPEYMIASRKNAAEDALLMPIHVLKLLSKKEVATSTYIFEFKKPDNFQFKAGQYGGFTLVNPSETDAAGNTRRFSLLSIADDDTISIITRVQQSAFKRVLKNLPEESEIKFAGPTGAFVLHDDESIPAVLIAGGIGIAPFYSMIRWCQLHKPNRKIILFYGNQSLADAALINELADIEKANPNIKIINTLVNPPENWTGETGFITHTMIKKHVENIHEPYFYVCGSPAMVSVLHETLQEMEIPEDKIRVEDFPGY